MWKVSAELFYLILKANPTALGLWDFIDSIEQNKSAIPLAD
jgi:hypothetical protein